MINNPLSDLKSPLKSDDFTIYQAQYIANNINLAILQNKNAVNIVFKDKDIDKQNLNLLIYNGFDVETTSMGSNISEKIYSYYISW